MALHSYDPLPLTLSHIIEAALEICPASLGVIELQSFEQSGNPQRHFVHLATNTNGQGGETAAEEIRAKIGRDSQSRCSLLKRRSLTVMDCWCR